MDHGQFSSFQNLINKVVDVAEVNFAPVIEKLKICLQNPHEGGHLDVGHQF